MNQNSNNKPSTTKTNPTREIKALQRLSKKLGIPLDKISEEGALNLKKFYKNYDIDFILNSWFTKEFLLIKEEGNYVAKIQTYDDDGFPQILNWHIDFGRVEIVEGDEFISHYSKAGFLQIGAAQNGDPLVLDLESKTIDIGYLSHEYVWGDKSIDIRKNFQKFTSFSKFIERIINNQIIPTEYKF